MPLRDDKLSMDKSFVGDATEDMQMKRIEPRRMKRYLFYSFNRIKFEVEHDGILRHYD